MVAVREIPKNDLITNQLYDYIDVGSGHPVILLHGLFGTLSNWGNSINELALNYRVIVPKLPLLDLDLRSSNLGSLVEYLKDLIEKLEIQNASLVGNSMGGHVALLFALKYPQHVASLVLVGSSGLFESSFGGTFPKRGDYDYVKNKVAEIFYNKEVATKELVDEVFLTTKSISNSMKIVSYAKSAQRNNLSELLHQIKVPTLIIWGKDDPVTPASVGERFNRAIKDSKLHLIPQCGHVPMMETPEIFNHLVSDFLKNNI